MPKYIGTKTIEAEPADRDGQPGYAVKYEDGYTSWSPKAAFEAAYREIGGPAGMSFSHAVDLIKLGYPMARAGWNGRGMCVFLTRGAIDADVADIPVDHISGVSRALFDGANTQTVTRMPHMCMINADGNIVPGWLASQTDMLAEDWVVAQ
jgi:hypothetical protein